MHSGVQSDFVFLFLLTYSLGHKSTEQAGAEMCQVGWMDGGGKGGNLNEAKLCSISNELPAGACLWNPGLLGFS